MFLKLQSKIELCLSIYLSMILSFWSKTSAITIVYNSVDFRGKLDRWMDRWIDLISPQWKTHGSNSQKSVSVFFCRTSDLPSYWTKDVLGDTQYSQCDILLSPGRSRWEHCDFMFTCTSHFCPTAAHILPRNHAELLRVPSLPVH